MRRKLAVITFAIVACFGIALATVPWWLGGALGVAGGRFGFTFSEYHRAGYGRFILEDVELIRPGLKVNASRVELGTPLRWLAQRPGPVIVAQWSVEITDDAMKPKDASTSSGWMQLRTRLETVLTVFDLWLPDITAGQGTVSWKGGRLTTDEVRWSKERGVALHVDALKWNDQTAEVMVTRQKTTAPFVVDARAIDGRWTATLISEGAQLTGDLRWWSQPISVKATFAEVGWMPREAHVKAEGWRLAAEKLKLGKLYEMIEGSAHLAWKEERFSVDINGEGKPLPASDAPPFHVQIRGVGGLDSLSIDRIDVRAPGIEAALSEPVVIGRDGRLKSGPSRFSLAVNLEEQPWIAGRGRVTGEMRVSPQDAGAPTVAITVESENAAVADFVATQAKVNADLEWPRLRVNSAELKLVNGDEIAASGNWDFGTRSISKGKLKTRVRRETVEKWMANRSESFEWLELEALAAGSWPGLVHEGRLKVNGARIPPVKPLALEIEWKGTGSTFEALRMDAAAGSTKLRARGVLSEQSARMDECVLSEAGVERLRLQSPVEVQWTPSLVLGDVHLVGAAGNVNARATWGKTGEVKLEMKQFESAWLEELLELPGPRWTIGQLSVQGNWDGGPATFSTSGRGEVQLKGGRVAELSWDAHGDGEGVRLGNLRATADDRPIIQATGVLPVSIHPGQTPLLRVDDSAPLALNAGTEPNAFFWEQLREMTGLILEAPEVRASLAGTVQKPLGEVTIRVGKIAGDATSRLRAMPEIEEVNARITAERGGVVLETFEMKVAKQVVRVNGRLPVSQWTALMKDPLSLVKAAGEVRIQIPNAEVSALARYAPAYLAPIGTLHVDVGLKRGGQLDGVIRLRDAASRPLGPLGTLQSISADIILNGRGVELKEVRASTGGQPVTLTGTAELTEANTAKLNLALRGEKLPFVRQAGLLMRGDIDLKIVTDASDQTLISGTTRLHDSFFLMDVRALLPSGGARNAPGKRPPYFAVNVPPFNEWRLDVAVEGDRFLRLRTPVFAGLASAHFRLGGTLGDPRAIGEATVNQGQVLLPFATFAVRQGQVRLTTSNPFEPAIALIGTSRRYGYDLRMEVSGTVERPQLVFTSIPPLESEQVLLMVMTGETPANEVSYSGRERAARLGAYLGQSLLKQLGGDPEGTERLSVSVGERISRQGRETYEVEYELTPRWSLVGEYDEFDEYNIGAKWRVWSDKKMEDDK